MVKVDFRTYYFLALLLLVIPAQWLGAALMAAVFHELCHLLVIIALGGTVTEIRIGVSGAVIEAGIPGEKEELLAAIAGPAGSFLLLSLCHLFPKIAICAFFQGLFNLIPVYPMDGGRALQCIQVLYCSQNAERIARAVEIITCAVLFVMVLAGSLTLSLGILPLLAVMLWINSVIRRKRPCKQRRIRVQ